MGKNTQKNIKALLDILVHAQDKYNNVVKFKRAAGNLYAMAGNDEMSIRIKCPEELLPAPIFNNGEYVAYRNTLDRASKIKGEVFFTDKGVIETPTDYITPKKAELTKDLNFVSGGKAVAKITTKDGLAETFRQSLRFTTKEQTRYALTCAYLDFENKSIVATDGKQLFYKEIELSAKKQKGGLLIPSKIMTTIQKMLAKYAVKEVYFTEKGGVISVNIDDKVQIDFQKNEGQFPNWKNIVKIEHTGSAEFQTQQIESDNKKKEDTAIVFTKKGNVFIEGVKQDFECKSKEDVIIIVDKNRFNGILSDISPIRLVEMTVIDSDSQIHIKNEYGNAVLMPKSDFEEEKMTKEGYLKEILKQESVE